MNSQLLLTVTLSLGLAAASLAAPRKPPAKPTGLAPMPVTAPKPPSATPAPGDVVLYNGTDVAAAGLAVAAWGGGTIEDSAEISFAKGHALKVTTLDPYQGARITFNKPVDLENNTADKTRMFLLTLRVTKVDRTFTAPPTEDTGNGFPGQFGGGAQTVSGIAPLKSLHLLFTLASGAQADILRPVPEVADGTEQWVSLAVPIAAIGFPAGAGNSPLQSVAVAGDDYAVFYVGQIKLIHDATPITAFAGARQDVAPRQPVTLHGTAAGGASALQYVWDFDDKDGVSEQAYGPDVTTQFLKAGDYKVTLTVSDIDGLKKPAAATMTVHVGQ